MHEDDANQLGAVWMLPAETYIQARQKARYHVQVQLDHVVLPAKMPGEAVVQAEVIQVFHADGGMRCGEKIEFRLCVAAYHEAIPPDDGIWWLPVDAIQKGACLEAFLNGLPPKCDVAMWQVTILDGAPSPPWMSPDDLD